MPRGSLPKKTLPIVTSEMSVKKILCWYDIVYCYIVSNRLIVELPSARFRIDLPANQSKTSKAVGASAWKVTSSSFPVDQPAVWYKHLIYRYPNDLALSPFEKFYLISDWFFRISYKLYALVRDNLPLRIDRFSLYFYPRGKFLASSKLR